MVTGGIISCVLSQARFGSGGEAWDIAKSQHFLVYYENRADEQVAQRLLEAAERYYRQITTRLGFTRYGDFWTWENRAKIFLFTDQTSFTERTHQPAWSTGFSDRDSQVFQSRLIVTYKQEKEFYDGLLPHEISHLILHDFIPDSRLLPIWFDEGVAQLSEPKKSEQARRIMKGLVLKRAYVPFEYLAVWDVRQEADSQKVTVFYAQSLSIVEFLITRYGSESFGRLCRALRDGKNFPEALKIATSQELRSMLDLEKAWLKTWP